MSYSRIDYPTMEQSIKPTEEVWSKTSFHDLQRLSIHEPKLVSVSFNGKAPFIRKGPNGYDIDIYANSVVRVVTNKGAKVYVVTWSKRSDKPFPGQGSILAQN